MESTFIFAGFGGQGVILAGKLLAEAGMDHGLHVTWLPSYGPEMRGGTANCTVVLSDEPIGSPVVDNPTALVAMNLPSLDRFEKAVNGVRNGGGQLVAHRAPCAAPSDVRRALPRGGQRHRGVAGQRRGRPTWSRWAPWSRPPG
jgi:hypothetical protein